MEQFDVVPSVIVREFEPLLKWRKPTHIRELYFDVDFLEIDHIDVSVDVESNDPVQLFAESV